MWLKLSWRRPLGDTIVWQISSCVQVSHTRWAINKLILENTLHVKDVSKKENYFRKKALSLFTAREEAWKI